MQRLWLYIAITTVAAAAGLYISSRSGPPGPEVPTALPAPSSFQATLRGDLEASLGGNATFDAAGTEIRLGVDSRDGAILLRRPRPMRLLVGTWEIGTGSHTGFRGYVVSGPPERPGGVFRADSGSLTITAVSPVKLEGRFAFRASGDLTRGEWTPARVEVSGSFVAAPERVSYRLDPRTKLRSER